MSEPDPDRWLERARRRSAAGDRGGALTAAGEFCRLAPERGHEIATLLGSLLDDQLELVSPPDRSGNRLPDRLRRYLG